MVRKRLFILSALLISAVGCTYLYVQFIRPLRGIGITGAMDIATMDRDCDLDQYNAIEKCNVIFEGAREK